MKGLNDLAMWKMYRKMNFIHVVAIGMAVVQIGGTPVKVMASETAKPESESAVVMQSEDTVMERNQEGEISEEEKQRMRLRKRLRRRTRSRKNQTLKRSLRKRSFRVKRRRKRTNRRKSFRTKEQKKR